jgi:type II secretion system protein H
MPKRGLQVKNVKTRRGFTLIELLVVIAILSLMASVGAGMLLGTYNKLNVDKAASNLFLTAKYARMMAVEQQKHYKLCLDTTNNAFYLVTTIDSESGQSEETIVTDPYCKPVILVGDIKIEDIQITPIALETTTESEDLPTIIFLPDGTAQSAVVQIGNERTHYTVSINAATGKAKLSPGTIENVKVSTVDLDAE